MSTGYQFDERLSALDEIMLRAEQNPKTRNWVLSLMILEKKPNKARLLEQLERASRDFIRLRQIATPAPTPLGFARWQASDSFKVCDHFQNIAMPKGSSFQDLLSLTSTFLNKPGDLSKPLWDSMLIDNIQHPAGTTAFVFRMHHAVADGVGAVQLFLSLFDTEPTGRRDFADLPVSKRKSWLQRVSADIQDSLPAVRKVSGIALQTTLAHIKAPIQSLIDDKHLLDSIQRLYGPTQATASPLLAQRSLARGLLAWDFEFNPFKRALKQLGWSVNEGYLTALTLGLKDYHEQLHCPVDSLPITIPVNIRQGGASEQSAGNHIAPAKIILPIALSDPHEIADSISNQVRSAIQEPALRLMDWLAPTVKGAPQFVVDRIADSMAQVDVQASNVPGYPFAPYLAGSKITRSYPFAPLPGVALMVALYTQNDIAHIGIQLDQASIDEPDRLEACLKQGFEQITALGHKS